jgi:cation diffusion facilitator family transporter
MHTHHTDIRSKKTAVAALSVVSNSALVILKLVVGISIGSIAVISEAIHSGVDLLAAVIALIAVRISGKPADEEHPFGHGKVENISGTIEAALIFLAAGWIIFEAIRKIIHPEPIGLTQLGVGVMALSVAANMFVSHMLFKVGRETDSIALLADAWHLRTDVWTSFGVMFGLGVVWLGRLVLPQYNLQILDPIAAIIVAMLIIKAAWELTLDSGKDLLDARLPIGEEEIIRRCIAQEKKLAGFHDFRTRKSGAHRFVEFHIQVSPGMSVSESHAIADRIENEIERHIAQCVATIHVDPCDEDCVPCPAECEDRKHVDDAPQG